MINTAAARPATATRDHLGGLATFGIALGLTTLTIAALHLVAPGASRTVELIALVIANLVATLVRFLLLRAWITPASGQADRRTEPVRRSSTGVA